MTDVRLTTLSHGGGCGCKIAPAVLSQMLAELPLAGRFPDLLVGAETSDDAAVYRIGPHQAVVATTDFFMPIVDDPYDFGRIAATNALSDVYAMGGAPILALAVVGMPVDKLPVETVRKILAGGAAVCEAAGIPIAGGHSIDSPEPIYGLVALGLVHPDKLKRNDGARPGDVLILGKPLGIGVLSAALKKGRLDAAGYARMIEHTTRLNSVGTALAELDGVHAMTDVTGFGLLGHLLEICRGSQLGAEIVFGNIPVIDVAMELARDGYATGAAVRNWDSYGASIRLDPGLAEWQRKLLCDPQTSGGLLVACDPASAGEVMALFESQGYGQAGRIGRMRGLGDVTGICVEVMKDNPPQSPLIRGEEQQMMTEHQTVSAPRSPLVRGEEQRSSQSHFEGKTEASSPPPLDNPPDKGGRGVGGRGVGSRGVQRAIYLPYDKNLTALARENRKNPTPAESLLWNKVLRCRQFARYKFLRQKPIGSYIVDFYCSELQLVIEIDGDSHARQIGYDSERTRFLNSLGLEVVRYANQEVLHNLAGVFADLSRRVETRT
ncbi:selenide, water dikinase SelD [Methylococcus sp. Mc7]|uniref:selenide, water dikinase SelD n=1 Tax=Methylococcus sp. Mc7 TaxID=2860258 RepID=UPI001C533038|nr:selenide, water dikinase SelD [Methylococcus sp. Mc7]QXP82850.1 selenide, water dikinase SelD [Methylococcus sp. Mc7]